MEKNMELFEEFVKVVNKATNDDAEVVALVRKRFKHTNPTFISSSVFHDSLALARTKIETDAENKYVHLKDFVNELKSFSIKKGKRRLTDSDTDSLPDLKRPRIWCSPEGTATTTQGDEQNRDSVNSTTKNGDSSNDHGDRNSDHEDRRNDPEKRRSDPEDMNNDHGDRNNEHEDRRNDPKDRSNVHGDRSKKQGYKNGNQVDTFSSAQPQDLKDKTEKLRSKPTRDCSKHDRNDRGKDRSDSDSEVKVVAVELSSTKKDTDGPQSFDKTKKNEASLETPDATLEQEGIVEQETITPAMLAQENQWEIPEERKASKRQIKKLELFLQKCSKEIQRLEEEEESMNDLGSDDSNYVLCDRYKKKFIKVWNKYCSLVGCSPSTGRPTQKRFRFEGSRYPEVNRKIERFINRERSFPDYPEIRHIVHQCNIKYKLHMAKRTFNEVSRDIFTQVGNQLQQRRLADFESDLGGHLTENMRSYADPALYDRELKAKLDANRKEFKTKMDEVLTKYSTLQETHGEDDESEEEEEEEEEEEKEIQLPGESDGDLSLMLEDHVVPKTTVESDVAIVEIEANPGRSATLEDVVEEIDGAVAEINGDVGMKEIENEIKVGGEVNNRTKCKAKSNANSPLADGWEVCGEGSCSSDLEEPVIEIDLDESESDTQSVVNEKTGEPEKTSAGRDSTPKVTTPETETSGTAMESMNPAICENAPAEEDETGNATAVGEDATTDQEQRCDRVAATTGETAASNRGNAGDVTADTIDLTSPQTQSNIGSDEEEKSEDLHPSEKTSVPSTEDESVENADGKSSTMDERCESSKKEQSEKAIYSVIDVDDSETQLEMAERDWKRSREQTFVYTDIDIGEKESENNGKKKGKAESSNVAHVSPSESLGKKQNNEKNETTLEKEMKKNEKIGQSNGSQLESSKVVHLDCMQVDLTESDPENLAEECDQGKRKCEFSFTPNSGQSSKDKKEVKLYKLSLSKRKSPCKPRFEIIPVSPEPPEADPFAGDVLKNNSGNIQQEKTGDVRQEKTDVRHRKTGDVRHGKTGDVGHGKTGDDRHGKSGDNRHGKSSDDRHEKSDDVRHGKSGDVRHGKSGDVRHEKSGDDRHRKSGDVRHGKSGDDRHGKTGDDRRGKSGDDRHGKSGDDRHGKSGEDRHRKTGDDRNRKSGDDRHGKSGDVRHGNSDDRHRKSGDDRHGKSGDDRHGKSGDDRHRKSGDDRHRKSGDVRHGKTGDDRHGKSGDGRHGKTGDDKHRKSGDVREGKTGDAQQRKTVDVERETSSDIKQGNTDNIQEGKNSDVQQGTNSTEDQAELGGPTVDLSLADDESARTGSPDEDKVADAKDRSIPEGAEVIQLDDSLSMDHDSSVSRSKHSGKEDPKKVTEETDHVRKTRTKDSQLKNKPSSPGCVVIVNLEDTQSEKTQVKDSQKEVQTGDVKQGKSVNVERETSSDIKQGKTDNIQEGKNIDVQQGTNSTEDQGELGEPTIDLSLADDESARTGFPDEDPKDRSIPEGAEIIQLDDSLSMDHDSSVSRSKHSGKEDPKRVTEETDQVRKTRTKDSQLKNKPSSPGCVVIVNLEDTQSEKTQVKDSQKEVQTGDVKQGKSVNVERETSSDIKQGKTDNIQEGKNIDVQQGTNSTEDQGELGEPTVDLSLADDESARTGFPDEDPKDRSIPEGAEIIQLDDYLSMDYDGSVPQSKNSGKEDPKQVTEGTGNVRKTTTKDSQLKNKPSSPGCVLVVNDLQKGRVGVPAVSRSSNSCQSGAGSLHRARSQNNGASTSAQKRPLPNSGYGVVKVDIASLAKQVARAVLPKHKWAEKRRRTGNSPVEISDGAYVGIGNELDARGHRGSHRSTVPAAAGAAPSRPKQKLSTVTDRMQVNCSSVVNVNKNTAKVLGSYTIEYVKPDVWKRLQNSGKKVSSEGRNETGSGRQIAASSPQSRQNVVPKPSPPQLQIASYQSLSTGVVVKNSPSQRIPKIPKCLHSKQGNEGDKPSSCGTDYVVLSDSE